MQAGYATALTFGVGAIKCVKDVRHKLWLVGLQARLVGARGAIELHKGHWARFAVGNESL